MKTESKSFACSRVLQFMDKDYTYSQALGMVLDSDISLNKEDLERELNIYI
jgi:hypothetical protein